MGEFILQKEESTGTHFISYNIIMSKILITGAGGYIGSVATDLFLSRGYEVVGLDNFQTGYREPLEFLKNKYPNQFRYYEADLKNNLSPIFEKEKNISAVIHYAASCVVDESVKNPGKYFFNNVAVTANLLSHMDRYEIKTLSSPRPARFMVRQNTILSMKNILLIRRLPMALLKKWPKMSFNGMEN